MIVQVQKLNRIICSFFMCFLALSCSAQKINVNHIVDTYIKYYEAKNNIFSPSKTYLQLGINQENEDYKEKKIYINNNCFECMGEVDKNNPIIEYKGYKIVVFFDNSVNKDILLKNFKNVKKTERFLLNNINKNIINDVGMWTFSYNKNLEINFFCNTNYMKDMDKDMKEIKQELGIQNVADCISVLMNDIKR